MMLKWMDMEGSHNLIHGYGWIWISSNVFAWIWTDMDLLIFCQWIWIDMDFTNPIHVNL